MGCAFPQDVEGSLSSVAVGPEGRRDGRPVVHILLPTAGRPTDRLTAGRDLPATGPKANVPKESERRSPKAEMKPAGLLPGPPPGAGQAIRPCWRGKGAP